MDLHKTASYHYELPEELIAQVPLQQRDSSRLMLLEHGNEPQHLQFSALLNLLKPGDCLVLNNTKVLPARLIGRKAGGTATVEVLLLRRVKDDYWETLVKPGKRIHDGTEIIFIEDKLKCKQISTLEDGKRLMQFSYQGIWQEILDLAGTMPLPPYIHEQLSDQARYQTVYAKNDGSAAAPTAGLHFTPELLSTIKAQGIKVAEITLHVGLGTFRPVKVEDVSEHHMHSEWYEINEHACNLINETRANGGRVIAVGTTVCRTLETVALDRKKPLIPSVGDTSIFIYPGYKFKVLDGLITNFHLPESTLLMLVSAFYGYEEIMQAYKLAVEKRYRFFSFGDAMFLLP